MCGRGILFSRDNEDVSRIFSCCRAERGWGQRADHYLVELKEVDKFVTYAGRSVGGGREFALGLSMSSTRKMVSESDLPTGMQATLPNAPHVEGACNRRWDNESLRGRRRQKDRRLRSREGS